MTEVVLVRHASPVLERDVPAGLWRLDASGRAAARALRDVLPAGACAVSSDERKALETAELAGLSPTVDARLGETRRPDDWHDDFATIVRAFLNGSRPDGWEPREAVAERVDAAIRDAVETRAGPLVVFTHGQALTLWLRRIGAIEDAAAFWSELALPDVWRVTGGHRIRPCASRWSLSRVS